MTLGGHQPVQLQGTELYESMYSRDSNALLTGTAREMFDAVRQLKSADPDQYLPADGVNYGSPTTTDRLATR